MIKCPVLSENIIEVNLDYKIYLWIYVQFGSIKSSKIVSISTNCIHQPEWKC